MRIDEVAGPLVMHTTAPPKLETFSHWPSWLNACGHLDRSACFELRVSQVRRLSGCVPVYKGPTGKMHQDKGKRPGDVPDLPNERPAINGGKLISCGYYDLWAHELDWLARQQMPRRLAGDWRTGRAPAMRRVVQTINSMKPPSNDSGDEGFDADDVARAVGPRGRGPAAVEGASASGAMEEGPPRRCSGAWFGMSLEQGGHGPGERVYERKLNCWDGSDALLAQGTPHPGPLPGGAGARQLPAPAKMPLGLPSGDLDAGLDGNPNRGACREKIFGLSAAWVQRLAMEKHRHASVSGKQYFLVCPGGMMGDRSGCRQTAYKLFWVLARPGEHRDAQLAEQWIASLDSRGLSRQSAQVSALVQRYGAIMGERVLRCRHCLKMNYGKSPEASRKTRERKRLARLVRRGVCTG